MTPDGQIVERVRRGETQAYGTLIDRYERMVFGMVLSIIRDWHEAEDVTQEVFVQGYRKLSLLRDGSRFPSWLMRIARREAVRAAKQQRRDRELEMAAAANAPDADCQGSLLDEQTAHLLRQVQSLPMHERLVISMHYFDGHTVREIAETTGRPVGTVTKQLSRATERLRKTL